MSPLGGFTMNFWGEEVWTLKATVEAAHSDLRRTLARHLELSTKLIRTSWSETSIRFLLFSSIGVNMEKEREFEMRMKSCCRREY